MLPYHALAASEARCGAITCSSEMVRSCLIVEKQREDRWTPRRETATPKHRLAAMDALSGQRFELDLGEEDQEHQQLPDTTAAPPAATAFGFVGDVKERPMNGSAPPQPPSLKNNATGFPAHKDRAKASKFKQSQSAEPPAILKNDEEIPQGSQPPSATAGPTEGNAGLFEASERQRIDAENAEKIAGMSPEEIAQERQELFTSLNPTLVQKLLQRSTIEDESQPDFDADLKTSSRSSHRRSPSAGSGRKVSFAIDQEQANEQVRRPTAERHSISSQSVSSLSSFTSQETEEPEELQKSPRHKRRPSPHSRKVSFAVPDSESQNEEAKPTAEKHSISPSPHARSVSTSNSDIEDEIPLPPPAQPLNPLDSIQPTVHFPKPDQSTLDPTSDTFLDDLHKTYFPNVAHDPTKLTWMQPATASENAAYDPTASTVAPKDLRFDFNGRLIPPRLAATLPTNLGLHNHADTPDAAGYAIPELARLARSAFPAQRCIAVQTLGRILYRLGIGEFGDENDVDVVEPEGVGERAIMAAGLWDAVEEGRVIETLTEEAGRKTGHQTSIMVAQEAVWNWRRGGGRKRKAV